MITSNLKHIMDVRKITVEQLAIETQMSTSTIFRARSSALIGSCSLRTLEKIAIALQETAA